MVLLTWESMRNEICKLSGTCAKTDREQETKTFFGNENVKYRKTPFQGKFKTAAI
jgi:hypothetical protein